MSYKPKSVIVSSVMLHKKFELMLMRRAKAYVLLRLVNYIWNLMQINLRL